MRRARVAAGNDETPRTRNSSAPSNSTGAVVISASTAPVVSCALDRAVAKTLAKRASDRIARDFTDIGPARLPFPLQPFLPVPPLLPVSIHCSRGPHPRSLRLDSLRSLAAAAGAPV